MISGAGPALLGGVLIGLSAVLLLWLTGRVAGISGIVGGVLLPCRGDVAWRVAFLAGLIAAAAAVTTFWPDAPPMRTGTSPWLLVLAGLLVGVGTRMGNGCTSGHGVCGLGRLSRRSLVAVAMFMATAMATVYVVRHAVGA